MKKDISNQLFEKAKTLMPGGVNSPVRAFRSVGGIPIFMKKGKGAYITDEDGNEYIDYCCSWGPLILGHANENTEQAIIETLKNGTSFGAPTALENELADLIISNHSCIEKIRFVSSGTEAVMSALRLARGVTKKNKIIKFEGCYHGHVDSLLVKAGSGLVTFGESVSAGVPDSFANETIVLPLNDEDAVKDCLEKLHQDIAAIIIEPIPANNGLLLQSHKFLLHLRELCTQYNVLLIFDEVISGFRVGFQGAAGLYEIKPDILTFGKIIGGGMPVGAYGASHVIMDHISPLGSVYQAGTLSGNPVAMSAGLAQLKACLQPHFYQDLQHKTDVLVDGVKKHIQAKDYEITIYNIGSIFWFAFSDMTHLTRADQINAGKMSLFAKVYHYLLEHGIYFGPSGYEVGFVSAAHSTADIQKTIQVICDAFDKVMAE
ncbi:MAG TPA: glutamate-1-semialdehyde 2,1-aminomutase [Chitinophagales bacterium]|nr:glutamate-1-semialdehyde 2,1-aminomutase [Chitinophagales bacterium]HNB49566.1 glutamate-1-semialdehyde 2,1-aminomutase [Chitinophagales bacterium]HNC72919.1 glutamate-1-semialdehyde 2,1-aminomutase [Chitinophagales bacterium]HNI31759.1 glutamate-1-semialdehyde 2,1-aminomutase [Chitinophagales bacterium]HNN25145.1 glutamate-1-semialdehyde 2,1-aminomutase [Chitinophagales bacterium]